MGLDIISAKQLARFMKKMKEKGALAEDIEDSVELPQEWYAINDAYEALGPDKADHKLKGGVIYKDFEGNIQVFPLAPPYGIRTDEVGEKYAQSSIAMYNSKQQLMVKPATDGRHTVSLRQLDAIFGGGSTSDLGSEKTYSIGKNNIAPVNKDNPQPYVFGRDKNNVFSAKNYNEAAIANNLVDRDAQGKAKVEAPDVNSTTPDNKHVVNVDYANRKYLAKTGGTMTGNLEIKTKSNPSVKFTDSSDGNSAAYVQAHKGKAYMGYGAAKSISVDKSGNAGVPGNLTVVGSISCGDPKKDTDAVNLKTLKDRLKSDDIASNTLSFKRESIKHQIGFDTIAHGDGVYCGVKNGSIYNSTDGVGWNLVGIAGSSEQSSVDIAYGNGKFIIVGSNQALVDKDSWTITPITIGEEFTTTSVIYANGMFIVTGIKGEENDINGNRVMWSEDGYAWQTAPIGKQFVSTFVSIAYNKGTYVALSERDGLYVSDDLINWTMYEWDQYHMGYVDNPEIVIATTKGFFACENDRFDAWFSENGVDWTYLGYLSETGCVSVACGNGKIVALTAEGKIYVFDEESLKESYEHHEYFDISNGENHIWTNVVYANGYFIATNHDSLVYSINGINWTDYVYKFTQNDQDVTADIIDFISNCK